MRNTISVKGARENNLKNVNVDIPRDKLVVLTGLSGSGKSSLAFETIYAEGQRRFLESLSAFSRKFVAQLKKPDVDGIYGLSPVISIEQKSVSRNPRSTVGTITDIFDYLRVLYATSGIPHCPRCRREVSVRSAAQISEHVMALPQGTLVELDAPIFKIYGEDYPYLLADIRTRGYRRMRIDGELVDISGDVELDETREYEMEVVVDTIVVKPDVYRNLRVSVENGLRVGEGFLRFPHPHARQVARRQAGRLVRVLRLPGASDHLWRDGGLVFLVQPAGFVLPHLSGAGHLSARTSGPAGDRQVAQHQRRLLHPRGVPLRQESVDHSHPI